MVISDYVSEGLAYLQTLAESITEDAACIYPLVAEPAELPSRQVVAFPALDGGKNGR